MDVRSDGISAVFKCPHCGEYSDCVNGESIEKIIRTGTYHPYDGFSEDDSDVLETIEENYQCPECDYIMDYETMRQCFFVEKVKEAVITNNVANL